MKRVVYVLLTLALILQSCATMTGANRALYNADSLFTGKKYSQAIYTYKDIIRDYPGSSIAADAKFAIAYILIDSDNPDANYEQALVEFDEFIRSYPYDPRVQEAKNWYAALKAFNDIKKENVRLNKNIQQLKELDIRREKMSR